MQNKMTMVVYVGKQKTYYELPMMVLERAEQESLETGEPIKIAVTVNGKTYLMEPTEET